jgi:16S rRNA (guanine527-N7)-methyltransferase
VAASPAKRHDTEAGERLGLGARIALGRSLTEGETAALLGYCDLIRSWSRVHRLVGSDEIIWLIDNVVLDSLLFVRLLPAGARSLVDIGSGVGAPGIPIAVVRPELDVTLAEARQRRASFLSTSIRELRLLGCVVFDGRAEDLATRRPRQFDAAVSRCAGPPASIRRLAAELVRPGGVLVVSGTPEKRGPRAVG